MLVEFRSDPGGALIGIRDVLSAGQNVRARLSQPRKRYPDDLLRNRPLPRDLVLRVPADRLDLLGKRRPTCYKYIDNIEIAV